MMIHINDEVLPVLEMRQESMSLWRNGFQGAFVYCINDSLGPRAP
jgi:hypothetical protein